ncbi:3-hydroxyacyl-CoA dehydrogenase NAD-binding domain-containing protein [Staphylococcus pseudoxylosus]|uniref:3-hydroxyacyl-CoA dehydrogenase NAD-binding domain-containing protein n=1 Tax=Staphylococcus pseudoxylosus TaxID=2282419 RepID=UPI000D1FC5DC|nr:3-hydroxyacyl-CoA dehydrogenase NAD-binding domain-containing protein [Staphylococcus pseudoxylosus]PTI84079.1 L-carnitine dehydrogenase [Staphylococcus xylosus]MBM2657379.1 L-carnitine dehydrogenase [Staphylococcus pseudoxylosus]MEB5782219.1 3-hydroxyacyl-CoA dehydrogenase NAD-binding domain-containing protein [Staphylococcus pseudoxylosus]MEB6170018.1 3-hydroxyacyl-CoA dehydrogenase NAD-binding domain-containing protein [Staphylococcus pseudoxylosus]RQM83704.1 3-hydroxybutyryl-CoA dehydro
MKFAVVGTGVIGSGWITRILAHGHEVIATDPSENAFESMLKQVKQNWPYAEQLGLAENASLENLTFTPHLEEAVKDADHIQENVPEIESLKDQVLTEIDFYAKPDAIIGSSTSGIMPSELQKHLQHPERLVVAHPFHPVYILPLVEIVPGKLTTEETTVKAETIYESIGMDVLHVRHEIEGHVADRLMEALWREALHIVNDGIATTEEVDKAFTHAAGLRYAQYGPFMTFHLAGGEGGMRHMLKQFGPALKKPWTKLLAPELTQELYDEVVNGCESSSQGQTMSELDQKRNEFLVKVKQLAETYWPEETPSMKKSNNQSVY